MISEQFRQSNIDAHKDTFYQTGAQHVTQLFATLERNHVDHSKFKDMFGLRLWCGTHHASSGEAV